MGSFHQVQWVPRELLVGCPNFFIMMLHNYFPRQVVVEDKAFANPLKQEQKTFVNARGRDLYDKQDFPFPSTQPF